MIVLTVKNVKIDNIHTIRLFQISVCLPRSQIAAVHFRPVEKGAFAEIGLIIDLHFHIHSLTVHIQFEIQTAEFPFQFLRRQFHILNLDFPDILPRYLQQGGYHGGNNILVVGVAKHSFKDHVEL